MFEAVHNNEIWHILQEIQGLPALERIILTASLETKLFAENLRQGVKNEPSTKTKDVYIQNFLNLTKKKHSEYSEVPLLIKSIKYIKLTKGTGWISCPKGNSRKA